MSFIFNACKEEEEIINDNYTPIVKSDSSYNVLKDEDVIYANGLSHDESSTITFSLPLKLDIYKPENSSENRPVFMWIHGGGFTGGIKHNPEIVKIANYYASRGWVFISIDYRTTEELGNTQGMNEEEVLSYYRGIAPNRWIDSLLNNAQTSGNFKKGIATYMAIRDSKAALNTVLDTYEMVYGLEQYDRYDANDPELFLGHGQADDTQTPYEEALELQSIYESLGLYNKLVTLFLPNGAPAGHGAWDAVVDGKELPELTFDFLTERQNLIVD